MLKGTKFQIMVWNELKKIPEGEVRTYKEIAVAIGKPNSARAVANACAHAFATARAEFGFPIATAISL